MVYVIVMHHWCYMSLELWYMSVLWNISFMLWYYDTPLVLNLFSIYRSVHRNILPVLKEKNMEKQKEYNLRCLSAKVRTT
jgi:hypothetical protein